ncbi:DUF927 domain-containing protein [Ottowia sp. VDI28]|uniref:DUF927 domain-containing protein n=1 Tax=Ottowia sp. VDI28 TaxID=3133968 RepID=UPI003C2DD3B6
MMSDAYKRDLAALDDSIASHVGKTGEMMTNHLPFAVPGESERPCFKVLDDWTELDGVKFKPGVHSFGLKRGKKEDDPPSLTHDWVCGPLYIEAVTTDAHGSNYGRQLRFRTSLGKWRSWAMPMELLRADGADLRGELLHMGLEIDPGMHRALSRYLQALTPERNILCTAQTGWAGQVFVLPAEVIGPGSEGVVFQSGERPSDEYAQAGSMEGWKTGVAALAVGNPLLILAICAALAGPLLKKVNAESGGIHFVGDSSTGKTTAIEVACSVWGGEGFRRSWRATSNGMEGVAALFNDSLLALDEISECDPREVGAIVYSLGNGRGKQRASRTGTARAVASWKCSVLSSGERTIGTTMADGGQRIKAGQTVRLLDVPAQRRYGAWDELHGHASGAAFSDALKTASKTHYGHAGRAFLQALTRSDIDFADALEVMKARPQFQARDGQAKRAAARFALLALAGELATALGITQWQPQQAIEAAAEGFRVWLAERGDVPGNLERAQLLEKVEGFIERYGDSKFSAIGTSPSPTMMIRDRAGWWEEAPGGRVYLFTGDGMRECLRGYDFQRGLDVLREAGALPRPGADGKSSFLRRIDGQQRRVYPVNAHYLDAS